MKKALITGITGQDGSYLAEFLLNKGYEVHGIKRRSSSFNTQRIDYLYKDLHESNSNLILHYGDLTDASNIINIISVVKPQEIYNLGAQSHVKVSFELPVYTADVNAMGALRILEAIRMLGLEKETKFYQASTSELFGKVQSPVQNEQTTFYPQSPYACAKLFAYWITVNYREAYNMYAANGILFNHESPKRGETFVTRKITMAAARIKLGLQKKLYLGNLDAKRDWGHAKDYVEGMWKILQQPKADDFILSTGKTATVREFCQKAFEKAGISLTFEGKGQDEKGYDENGNVIIEVDPRYFRPTEVDALLGDNSKAKKLLDWQPGYTLEQTIDDMITSDLQEAGKEYTLRKRGLDG